MKSFLKQVTSSFLGQLILGFLIFLYVMLLRITCNFEYVNRPSDRNLQVIFSIWHSRLLLMPFLTTFMRRFKLYSLSSDHSDGRIVKYALTFVGIRVVIGSSSNGGVKALREMVKRLREGNDLFITPDGPKGPARELKSGVINVAKLSGIPIQPVSISSSNAKVFRSWDSFMLPKPFSRVVLVYGEPMIIPKDISSEDKLKKSEQLQLEMIELQNTADKLSGL